LLRPTWQIAFLTGLFFLGYPSFSSLAQPFGVGSTRPTEIKQHPSLGCPGGRFVFGQISDSSKDQYMLDTATGRLWRIAESGEVGIFLRPVPYRTESGRYSPLPDEPPPREKKKPGKN